MKDVCLRFQKLLETVSFILSLPGDRGRLIP